MLDWLKIIRTFQHFDWAQNYDSCVQVEQNVPTKLVSEINQT